jgi:hypothetical protein
MLIKFNYLNVQVGQGEEERGIIRDGKVSLVYILHYYFTKKLIHLECRNNRIEQVPENLQQFK